MNATNPADVMLRCCAVMYLLAGLNAQTLSIGTVPVAPGDRTVVAVIFEPHATRAAVALQWQFEYRAEVLAVDQKDITTGEAAKQAGKFLTCSGMWKKAPETYLYRCILAGGHKVIGAGPIAVLNAKVPAGAKPGRHKLRVTEALAVNAEAKRSQLPVSEAFLVIR